MRSFFKRAAPVDSNCVTVGIIPVFGWRPHVSHFVYLAQAIRACGLNLKTLRCDASITTCYNREIKGGAAKQLACTSCRISTSVPASYATTRSLFGNYPDGERPPKSADWAISSYRTITRTERSELDDSDMQSALFQRLEKSCAQTYWRVSEWIKAEKLDFVFFFNGRMDIMRATMEACRDAGIRYAAIERSIFNWGIQVNPMASCMDLTALHRISAQYADVPLDAVAADFAGTLLAARMYNMPEHITEWRAYNTRRVAVDWPVPGKRRILLVPSSANEVEGNSNYWMEWSDTTQGMEAVMDALGIKADEAVMRGHPNWSEQIGTASGNASDVHYRNWCESRGIHYIAPDSRADTNSLIAASDLVIVSHSSAAFEATALRRPVINIRNALYSEAGISFNMRTRVELEENVGKVRAAMQEDTGADERRRRLLRLLFTLAKRMPLFPDDVRPSGSTSAVMHKPAAYKRFMNIIQSGELVAAEYPAAETSSFEDSVLAEIDQRTFKLKNLDACYRPTGPLIDYPAGFRLAENLRSRFRRGDL